MQHNDLPRQAYGELIHQLTRMQQDRRMAVNGLAFTALLASGFLGLHGWVYLAWCGAFAVARLLYGVQRGHLDRRQQLLDACQSLIRARQFHPATLADLAEIASSTTPSTWASSIVAEAIAAVQRTTTSPTTPPVSPADEHEA